MTTAWLGSAIFVSSVALSISSSASQEVASSGEPQIRLRSLLQHGAPPLGLWVWPVLCFGVVIIPVAVAIAGSYAVSRSRRVGVLTERKNESSHFIGMVVCDLQLPMTGIQPLLFTGWHS